MDSRLTSGQDLRTGLEPGLVRVVVIAPGFEDLQGGLGYEKKKITCLRAGAGLLALGYDWASSRH